MARGHPPWSALVRGHHADRRPSLLARRRIKAALREWFAARDFVEVEAPILQVSPGNETHLHGFATELIASERRARDSLLAHVPGIRRQEAAGGRRKPIFEFARVVPQSRAQRAASSRIHHAGMVPSQRGLRRADGRFRGSARPGGNRPLAAVDCPAGALVADPSPTRATDPG